MSTLPIERNTMWWTAHSQRTTTSWSIYADYLEENGELDMAECIRFMLSAAAPYHCFLLERGNPEYREALRWCCRHKVFPQLVVPGRENQWRVWVWSGLDWHKVFPKDCPIPTTIEPGWGCDETCYYLYRAVQNALVNYQLST